MMKNKHVVVDVGFENAGFGGLYSTCVRKLRAHLGRSRVVGAYGYGFDMDQGIFVADVTSKEVKALLGDLTLRVKVIQASGLKLEFAELALA